MVNLKRPKCFLIMRSSGQKADVWKLSLNHFFWVPTTPTPPPPPSSPPLSSMFLWFSICKNIKYWKSYTIHKKVDRFTWKLTYCIYCGRKMHKYKKIGNKCLRRFWSGNLGLNIQDDCWHEVEVVVDWSPDCSYSTMMTTGALLLGGSLHLHPGTKKI